jgi:hypothetical protein
MPPPMAIVSISSISPMISTFRAGTQKRKGWKIQPLF